MVEEQRNQGADLDMEWTKRLHFLKSMTSIHVDI